MLEVEWGFRSACGSPTRRLPNAVGSANCKFGGTNTLFALAKLVVDERYNGGHRFGLICTIGLNFQH